MAEHGKWRFGLKHKKCLALPYADRMLSRAVEISKELSRSNIKSILPQFNHIPIDFPKIFPETHPKVRNKYTKYELHIWDSVDFNYCSPVPSNLD